MASILRALANHHFSANTTTSIASTSSRNTAGAREVNESFYELARPPGNASMQLLFFHGLQFQSFTNVSLSTWESRDGKCYWPQEWLVEKFPGSHVLYVSYDGSVGNSLRTRDFDIFNIAENFISDLLQADIGQVPGCPVILVGHSVGGIVIKQVFCQAHDLLGTAQGPKKEKLQTFLNNLRGIFFYGTPHHGSSFAEKALDLCGGPLQDYFKILSKESARLNEKFHLVRKKMYPKLLIAGVGESVPTRLGKFREIVIVPEASARCENFNTVDGDHFTICKPEAKTKRNYYGLENFLSTILGDIKAQELPENFQFVPDSISGSDGSKEEVIQKLVSVTSLQETATWALAELDGSKDESLKWRIARKEGVLGDLVSCLSKHDYHELQEKAAWALERLSGSKDESLKSRIGNEEGVLVALVNCLSMHENHGLQEAAAWALEHLAGSEDELLKSKIGSEVGALVGLVSCLSIHDNDGDVQEAAAWALAHLAESNDEPLKSRIGSEEGVLVGLANCLLKHENQELQEAAAWAFTHLTDSKDESLKSRIGSEKGVVVGLVSCLSKHDNHGGIQEAAAWALAHLADSKDKLLKSRIGNEEGALVGLVNCLSKHENHELQEAAAWALADLAGSTDETLKSRIGSEVGALVGLMSCLSKCDNHTLREAADALRQILLL